jgi:hypothetical protein
MKLGSDPSSSSKYIRLAVCLRVQEKESEAVEPVAGLKAAPPPSKKPKVTLKEEAPVEEEKKSTFQCHIYIIDTAFALKPAKRHAKETPGNQYELSSFTISGFAAGE